MNVDPGEFARALNFTLLIGAARADAHRGERLAALRSLIPRLKDHVLAGEWDEAEQLVRGVMPNGWEPSEEWKLPDDTPSS